MSGDGRYHFDTLFGAGDFTGKTPDTIFRICSNRPLFSIIPSDNVNKAGAYTRLAAVAYVQVKLNLYIRHCPPPFMQKVLRRQKCRVQQDSLLKIIIGNDGQQ